MSYYQALAHKAARKDPEPSKRKRARHPAGSKQAGQYVGDDPATPENEAFESEA